MKKRNLSTPKNNELEFVLGSADFLRVDAGKFQTQVPTRNVVVMSFLPRSNTGPHFALMATSSRPAFSLR